MEPPLRDDPPRPDARAEVRSFLLDEEAEEAEEEEEEEDEEEEEEVAAEEVAAGGAIAAEEAVAAEAGAAAAWRIVSARCSPCRAFGIAWRMISCNWLTGMVTEAFLLLSAPPAAAPPKVVLPDVG